jgi:hypothetical protein
LVETMDIKLSTTKCPRRAPELLIKF